MSVRFALRWAPALAAAALLSAACATPIGVIRGSTQEMHRTLTVSVLSAGKPSGWSTQVLHRTNLFKRFDDEPGTALGELRKALQHQGSPARLFALAELSFLHAEQSGQREHYLASAVYAYAFLFPEDGTGKAVFGAVRRNQVQLATS